MSDNFHKTAVLKKKNCKLKLDRIVQLQLMGPTRVPKFVRSVALDFPDICRQFFLGNFIRQEGKKITHDTVYFHVVAYPSRRPLKP